MTNYNYKDDAMEKDTGSPLSEWVKLTGLFDEDLKSPLLEYGDIECYGDKDEFALYHKGKNIRFKLIVNRKSMTLQVESVFIRNRRSGIGFNAHKQQIECAAKFGFKSIYILAYGGRNCDDRFEGHVSCAKFGYTMIKSAHHDFLKKGRRNKKAGCLQALVQRDEKFWFRFGYPWRGNFKLTDKESSPNWRLCSVYENRYYKNNDDQSNSGPA